MLYNFVTFSSCFLTAPEIVSETCIKRIFEKYVISSTLTIFFTEGARDNINIINEYCKDANISMVYKIKNLNKLEQNFLEERKENALIIFNNFEELFLRKDILMNLTKWNARAKYIFFSIHGTDMHLNEFIAALWECYLINSIILSPNRFGNYNIFTYFPYLSNSTNIEPVLIESCQTIQHNYISLYPNKIPNDLNGYKIKVRAVVWSPYVLFPTNITKNYNNVNIVEGIEIELLKTLAEIANFSVEYSLSSIPQDWGLITPNGSATGSMKALINKDADLAIGSIGPTLERHDFLDYAYCHLQEHITCCVPKAQKASNWRNLLDALHPFVWISIIVMYFVTSMSVWAVSLITPKDHIYGSLKNAFTYFLSLFLLVSVKSPNKNSSRLLFLLWIIFSLHIIISYEAKLISELTHPNFDNQIDTVEEVLQSNIPFVLLSTIRRFFANSEDWRVATILKNWKSCLDSDECLKAIAYKRNLAFFTTKVHMEFEIMKYLDSNGDSLIYCFDNIYLTYPAEIFMSKGFPLRDRISTLIMRTRDSGLIFKWQADVFRRYKNKYLKTVVNNESAKMALALSHLQGAFFISSIGWTAAILIFLVELLTHKFQKRRNII